MFVGWDWATTAHDVTVINSAGDRVHRVAILHTEDGIARAVAKLAGYGDPGELPVAIETTRGLVVDRLLAARHPVIPVHPNAFHAVPPRWGAPGDSFKLPGHRLRRIHTRRGPQERRNHHPERKTRRKRECTQLHHQLDAAATAIAALHHDNTGRERRAAARAARGARGQSIGRPKALDKSKTDLARRMHSNGEPASTIAAALGVSRATIYRVLTVDAETAD